MIIKNTLLPFFFSGEKIVVSLSVINDENPILSWLSNQELDRYHAFPSEKRKQHYALGRITAKHAIISIDSNNVVQEINISNSKKGNPIVENSDYCVSISHSKNYAIGLAFRNFSFGVDIEYVDKNRLSALKYITSDDEPIALNEKDLTIAWSMKESLSKAMLCGFNGPLKDFSIKQIDSYGDIYISVYKHHPEYKSIAMLLENFAIAITYDARLNIDYLQIQEILKSLTI